MKLAPFFATSVLLCVFVASFSLISPVSADAVLVPVGPQNTRKSIPEQTYIVWGEIRNDGDVPAGSIWITAQFSDYEGWPVTVGGGEPMLSVIHPGETSPFEIIYSGPEVEEIGDQTFLFEFSATDALPTGLEIVSHSSDTPGTVVGEVQNIGTEPTTQITVAATFYTSGGVVVGTASSDPIPGPLNPGENATFSVTLEYSELLPEVDNYALYAQSEEYAVVPEFPIWTSMLLILVMFTAAAVISKTRLLKTPIH
ncbi:MAG: hypothetical protein JSV75_02510 [Candidatus Bathyarchaeota archaeon]|nr:MAG: hypothetical protein JSV75_02510 [Candidatus Bathyarchaeota archaeon]